MQAHDDFVFHLEEPREQFSAGSKRVRGWIAAHEEPSALQVGERALRTEERPDVQRAFPNFAFRAGFVGEVDALDLTDGALRFSFVSGGAKRTVLEQLAAPPTQLSFVRQTRARVQRWLALRRLKRAHDEAGCWNAALDVFVAEVNLQRGDSFRREEIERLLALFAEQFPEAFVLQIGAAEGLIGDPLVDALAKTRWRALLVEPVPHLCAALRDRYRDQKRIRIEQAAVSARDGEAPLYRLRTTPGETPEWFNHLATLDRDVLLRQRTAIPNIDELVMEDRTATVRLNTLLARHQINAIDLLVIDTEGHDFEILRELDFTCVRPVLLMFEHQHLTVEEKAAAYELVHRNGYVFRETPEGDTIAWRTV